MKREPYKMEENMEVLFKHVNGKKSFLGSKALEDT